MDSDGADDQEPDNDIDTFADDLCIWPGKEIAKELFGDVHVKDGGNANRAKEADEESVSNVFYLVNQAEVVVGQHHRQSSEEQN